MARKSGVASINRMFPDAISLEKYLGSKLLDDFKLIQSGDHPSYIFLLQDAKVLPETGLVQSVWSDILPPTGKTPFLLDIFNRIIAQLVPANNDNKDLQNCFSLGYKYKDASSKSVMRDHTDIDCSCVNSIQAMLVNDAWKLLSERIGIGAFFR
jgi:hypothetical protein